MQWIIVLGLLSFAAYAEESGRVTAKEIDERAQVMGKDRFEEWLITRPNVCRVVEVGAVIQTVAPYKTDIWYQMSNERDAHVVTVWSSGPDDVAHVGESIRRTTLTQEQRHAELEKFRRLSSPSNKPGCKQRPSGNALYESLFRTTE